MTCNKISNNAILDINTGLRIVNEVYAKKLESRERLDK